MFNARKLCIATMHKKEMVIAPILEQQFGLSCFTCQNLNTDLHGTFSGEVERLLSPVEAAKAKCIEAMKISGCDMAVSSEGSFGPHPTLAFVPCDEEIIFFYDRKNDIEIVVKEISTTTNFASREIRTFSELNSFAERVQFPSHGLILKNPSGDIIAKGLVDRMELENHFLEAISKEEFVHAETDMRACFNPTRMSIIEKCTMKLAEALQSRCPQCQLPGFIIKDFVSGLPCEICHYPTRSTLKHIKICSGCDFKTEIWYPYQKQHEDAMYCDMCNP